MLLDDRTIDHPRAASALSLWVVGVALWVVVSLGRQAASWYAFSGDHDSFELVSQLFTGLQLGGIVAGGLIALGAWRYVSAASPRPLLRAAAAVFALDVLVDVFHLVVSLTGDGMDYEGRDAIYETVGHVWRVLAVLRVAGLLLFFTQMARSSETLGSPIGPARVWSAIGVAGLWGLVIAGSSLDLLPHGGLGMAISATMTALVGGTTLAVFLPHRRHLRGGAAPSESADSESSTAPGLEAAGRALRMYHGAIVAQIAWLVVGNGLTLLVAKTGDLEGAKGMMGLVPVVALIVQCFAIAGLVRFASGLPAVHAATGPAGLAAAGQVLNGLLALVTTGLVFRALDSGRLRHLFDLQDQLPVLQGISALVGCVAALALLTALERVGAERDVAGLKVAIPVLGGLALLFHLLDPRDLGGPMLLAFAVALLVGALVVVAKFLGVIRRTADRMMMGMP